MSCTEFMDSIWAASCCYLISALLKHKSDDITINQMLAAYH